MFQDFQKVPVRSSAVLTTSYVAGTLIDALLNTGTNRFNQLVILVDFTIGSLTTAEIKVEFAPALAYDLNYDGQTANFTVGKTITGQTTGVFSEILVDTDGGATGTLTISPPRGTKRKTINFIDNEAIWDNNSTVGKAVVNGSKSLSTYWFYQQTSSAVAGGTSTENLLAHQFSATGKYRIAVPIKDRYIRISAKGTGTVTNSLMRVDAVLGVV